MCLVSVYFKVYEDKTNEEKMQQAVHLRCMCRYYVCFLYLCYTLIKRFFKMLMLGQVW
jgi:hypothetical protein